MAAKRPVCELRIARVESEVKACLNQVISSSDVLGGYFIHDGHNVIEFDEVWIRDGRRLFTREGHIYALPGPVSLDGDARVIMSYNRLTLEPLAPREMPQGILSISVVNKRPATAPNTWWFPGTSGRHWLLVTFRKKAVFALPRQTPSR